MKRPRLALPALFLAVALPLLIPNAPYTAGAQSGRVRVHGHGHHGEPSPPAKKDSVKVPDWKEGEEAFGPEKEKETARAGRDEETIKIDVDLVVLDALVMQKKTARVVGDLRREDFKLYEDGVEQEITHFSRDALPLSVLLLIDRGNCLDPFGPQMRHAVNVALTRLKPSDEVAVMTYHNTAELLEGFTRDRRKTMKALDRVPPHDETAAHCLNLAFHEAAKYMISAGNPVGRRVIIVVTAVKSSFDCEGPSGKEARHAIFESGSVVSAIVPKTKGQRFENGVTRMATGMGGFFGAPTMSIDKLAEETGGEVMDDDKPDTLNRAFTTLMEHLRSRYSMGFASTNKKFDGGTRKLRLKLSKEAEKAQGKLAIKTRNVYVAPKRAPAPPPPQQAGGSGGVK